MNERIRTQAKLDSTYKSAEKAERSGDLKTAQKLLEDILAIDPNYKDVLRRLEIVRNKLKIETDSKKTSEPTTKTDKPKELEEIEPVTIKSAPDTSRSEIATEELETVDSTQIVAVTHTSNLDSIQVGETESTSMNISMGVKITLVVAVILAASFILANKYRSHKESKGLEGLDTTQTLPIQTKLSNESPDTRKVKIDKGAVPYKLDRYRIREQLGEGAMGVVHKAYNTKLNDKIVAIKFLKLDTSDPKEIANRTGRFDRAWRILARLDHPNIVSLIDYDQIKKNEIYKFYMVMEYVDGVSVDKMLEKNGSLNFDSTSHIIKQVLSALEYAHRNQVIHRDLKPSNIMVHKEGWVKVLDFDIAKVIGGTDSQLLTMGGRPGTPSYMSPEQLHGRKIDHRTDIFSLGLIFYEMLAGYLPDNETRYGKKSPDLETIRSDIPRGLDDIIAKMLALNPEDRYESAREIISILTALSR